MAIAKEHDVAALAAEIVPGAARIGTETVAVPGAVALEDLVDRPDADVGGADRPDAQIIDVSGDMPDPERVYAELGTITIAESFERPIVPG